MFNGDRGLGQTCIWKGFRLWCIKTLLRSYFLPPNHPILNPLPMTSCIDLNKSLTNWLHNETEENIFNFPSTVEKLAYFPNGGSSEDLMNSFDMFLSKSVCFISAVHLEMFYFFKEHVRLREKCWKLTFHFSFLFSHCRSNRIEKSCRTEVPFCNRPRRLQFSPAGSNWLAFCFEMASNASVIKNI